MKNENKMMEKKLRRKSEKAGEDMLYILYILQ